MIYTIKLIQINRQTLNHHKNPWINPIGFFLTLSSGTLGKTSEAFTPHRAAKRLTASRLDRISGQEEGYVMDTTHQTCRYLGDMMGYIYIYIIIIYIYSYILYYIYNTHIIYQHDDSFWYIITFGGVEKNVRYNPTWDFRTHFIDRSMLEYPINS